jgi:hypothetical protein
VPKYIDSMTADCSPGRQVGSGLDTQAPTARAMARTLLTRTHLRPDSYTPSGG